MLRIFALAVLLPLVAGLAMPALAEEPATSEGSDESVTLVTPDYSRDALLKILETEEVTIEVHEDQLEMRWSDWIMRFVPMVLPLTLSDGSYGTAQIHGPVNGLSLLGVDYPGLGPAKDEYVPFGIDWRERRFRRNMIALVNSANASDNR